MTTCVTTDSLWRIAGLNSAAYDINPLIERDNVLAINKTETASDLDIARAAHKMYALSLVEADV